MTLNNKRTIIAVLSGVFLISLSILVIARHHKNIHGYFSRNEAEQNP